MRKTEPRNGFLVCLLWGWIVSGSGLGRETGSSMLLSMVMDLKGGIGGVVFIRHRLLRQFDAAGVVESGVVDYYGDD